MKIDEVRGNGYQTGQLIEPENIEKYIEAPLIPAIRQLVFANNIPTSSSSANLLPDGSDESHMHETGVASFSIVWEDLNDENKKIFSDLAKSRPENVIIDMAESIVCNSKSIKRTPHVTIQFPIKKGQEVDEIASWLLDIAKQTKMQDVPYGTSYGAYRYESLDVLVGECYKNDDGSWDFELIKKEYPNLVKDEKTGDWFVSRGALDRHNNWVRATMNTIKSVESRLSTR